MKNIPTKVVFSALVLSLCFSVLARSAEGNELTGWIALADPGTRVDQGASAEAISFPDGSVGLYVTRPCPDSERAPDICLYRSLDGGFSFIHEPITGLLPGAHDPAVVYLPDQRTMRMYFVVRPEGTVGATGQLVQSATSDNGVVWVVEDGVRLDDPDFAGVPEVIPLPDGGYRMFYSAENRDREPGTFIKSATSSDGLSFIVDDGDRTPAYFSGPGIVEIGPGLWLMTVARVHPDSPHNKIFLATSTDTLNWTLAEKPIIKREDGNTFDPDLLVLEDGRIRLYHSFVPGCLGLGHDLTCGESDAATPVVSVVLPMAFRFSASSYAVGEGDGEATITVERVGYTWSQVSVDYTVSDGTATAGVDYNVAAPAGTLTFAAGETTKTITVSIVNDSDAEDNETVNLALSNPTGGAVIGSPDTAVLMIGNDDVSFRFKDLFYTVSEAEASGTATIRVERLGGSPETVTVNYATSDGTATAGADYSTTTGTLTFSPGDPGVKEFAVPILNDTTPESHETVNLTLSNPINPGGSASLATPSTAVLAILNDDVAFRFTSASYSVSESAGTASITVERQGETEGTVSVSFATSDGTAIGDFQPDYVPTSGTLTFNPGETTKSFTVSIVNDSAVEDNETVNLTLSNPTSPNGTAALATPSTAVLTIFNDDVSFRFKDLFYTVSEAAASGTATIRVEKLGGTPETVSVNFATSDGTATEEGAPFERADYVAASGTLTFGPGDPGVKEFTVPILNDTTPESDETVNLTLSNPMNPGGSASLATPNTAVLTILNDDFIDINTPSGTNVLVDLTPVSVAFANVTESSITSLTTSTEGASGPLGFELGHPPTYYEITTTAVYSGSVTVCINYSGVSFTDETNLLLFHLEGGVWVDHTVSLDTTNDIICASVTSLSPFAIFEPIPIPVTIDIKPGSFPNSINLGSGGTVPVAIFSTQTFDARTLNPSTITLASAPVKLKGQGTPMASFQDVNGDGLLDLVVHVSTEALQLSDTDTAAVLSGKTLDGRVVKGTDSIRVVP